MLPYQNKSPSAGKRIVNVPATLPPPVGGLNAISSIMGMPALDSPMMENWIPYPDRITSRFGAVNHVTGFANPVKRLWNYTSAGGAETLWATTDAGIYNATTAGAAPAASIALTSGKTIATMIATGANNYLMVVNGVDTLKRYDGAVWIAVPVFGAVATSIYSYIETYKQRLYLIRASTMTLDYLPVNSVAGAPVSYELGAIFRRGGYLMALATWTVDGGNGPDDLLAVATSNGEVAVFSGTDPATPADWAFKGVFYIGRPLGPLCFFKYGGDLLFNCEAGLFPLSRALLSASINRTQSITNKIQPLFSAAAQSFFSNEGWQVIVQPDIPLIIVNVPSTPVRTQYCMHGTGGGWTIFTGWEALCFGRLGGQLYWADATNKVARVNGNADFGANITCTLLTAYNQLGYPRNKITKLIRPYFEADGNFVYNIGYSQDFNSTYVTNAISVLLSGGVSLWGSGVWGTSLWSGSSIVTNSWRNIPDIYSSWKALYLQVVSNAVEVSFFGADLRMTLGKDH
jgi:hypothetical protein